MSYSVLPKAPSFTKYLEGVVDGPIVVDFEKRVRAFEHWGRQWTVRSVGGLEIGKYTEYNPKAGHTDGVREFRGNIPGFVDPQTGDGSVCLTYGETYAEIVTPSGNARDYWGEVSSDGFARIDGYKTIPFS